jgi:hypothetical protein
MRWSLVALVALAIAGGYAVSRGVGAESAQLAHGKYLVQLGGCTDCQRSCSMARRIATNASFGIRTGSM